MVSFFKYGMFFLLKKYRGTYFKGTQEETRSFLGASKQAVLTRRFF